MESHLQLHIEDRLRAGMSAEEARRQALLKLGGLELTKEIYRQRRGLPVLGTPVMIVFGRPLLPSFYDDPTAGKLRAQVASDRIMAEIARLRPPVPRVI